MEDKLLELMSSRYSCRNFKDDKVEQEKISRILKAAQVAPTACNFQPQQITVITSNEGLEKLNKCKKFRFNEQLAFLVCYDNSKCWVRNYDKKASGDIDCAIISTQMILEAKSLGIDSTWIMSFNPEAVINEFNLPSNIIPVAILAMGYASDDAVANPRHFERKELEETTKYL